MKSGIDWDAVNAAAREVSDISGDTIPPGWFTADQYAEHLGKHRETAWRRLRAMVKAGKAECTRFKVMQPSGRTYPVDHYRVTP